MVILICDFWAQRVKTQLGKYFFLIRTHILDLKKFQNTFTPKCLQELYFGESRPDYSGYLTVMCDAQSDIFFPKTRKDNRLKNIRHEPFKHFLSELNSRCFSNVYVHISIKCSCKEAVYLKLSSALKGLHVYPLKLRDLYRSHTI